LLSSEKKSLGSANTGLAYSMWNLFEHRKEFMNVAKKEWEKRKDLIFY